MNKVSFANIPTVEYGEKSFLVTIKSPFSQSHFIINVPNGYDNGNTWRCLRNIVLKDYKVWLCPKSDTEFIHCNVKLIPIMCSDANMTLKKINQG